MLGLQVKQTRQLAHGATAPITRDTSVRTLIARPVVAVAWSVTRMPHGGGKQSGRCADSLPRWRSTVARATGWPPVSWRMSGENFGGAARIEHALQCGTAAGQMAHRWHMVCWTSAKRPLTCGGVSAPGRIRPATPASGEPASAPDQAPAARDAGHGRPAPASGPVGCLVICSRTSLLPFCFVLEQHPRPRVST